MSKYVDVCADLVHDGNDLIEVTDMESIKNSLLGLLSTELAERPFEHNIGSRLSSLLFTSYSPDDPLFSSMLENLIGEVIDNHEPRVILDDVIVEGDDNTVKISILFRVSSIDIEQLYSLDFNNVPNSGDINNVIMTRVL